MDPLQVRHKTRSLVLHLHLHRFKSLVELNDILQQQQKKINNLTSWKNKVEAGLSSRFNDEIQFRRCCFLVEQFSSGDFIHPNSW